ncbi:hypothetical protein POTOM_016269 [Populus tomentosa]|uniref:Uncharacterized protein n=1 Tax=Populus tomentosa TaxID=118781 RepID=A0A8X8A4J8_POPTO|nr:hypothetical protein POTOM_016269 [Populus tomentosa]
MAENSSSGGSSMPSAPARSDDPAWAHGIKGQVEACKKVPPDVKWQMKQLIEDLTMEKEKRKRLRIDIGNSQSLSNDEVEEGDSANPTLSDIGSQANKRLAIQGTTEVTRGLLSTITRLIPECDTQDVISGQLEEYKKATGDFGMPLAIRQREKLNPEPSLLNGDDISWETIEATLSTLTLEDEETCFDEENIELDGNDQLLECLVDDLPYIPPQDQDPYFYVNDGDDV